MAIDMYTLSSPVYTRMLTNLLGWFDKAQAHAEAKKFDANVLLTTRLAPDMLPFKNQIQMATDNAKGAVARLGNVEIPKFEDDEKTIDELRARVRKTLDFIATVPASAFEGSETRDVTLPMRQGPWTQPGQAYLLHFALPNFYFHMTTAYSLLRHNGVDIGKMDFLGPR